VGCAFAIVGICVATQDRDISNALLVMLLVIILIVIFGDTIIPIFMQYDRLMMIIIVDIIALIALIVAVSIAT
jgi:hypothetical protein